MPDPTDEYTKNCVSSWFHIFTAADLATIRMQLLTTMWPGPNAPPTRMVDTITTGASAYSTTGMVSGWGTNLASTELWTINEAGGKHAYVYVYRPTSTFGIGNRIAICHHGHEDHGYGVEDLVQLCITTGLTTLECFMPSVSYGPNTTIHDYSTWAEMAERFLEPTVVALNQVLQERSDWQRVGMAGVSGGGWTTVMMAAADPRIMISYPVSGCLPLAIWRHGADATPCDVESYDAYSLDTLYGDDFNGPNPSTISYCDLYVLGACGTNRKQVQCHNAEDLFFKNYDWLIYERKVAERSTLCGGNFSINVLNPSQGAHSLWPQFRTAFMNDMTVPVVPGNRGFGSRR